MTELLERAIAKLKALTEEEQDTIAAWFLDEIEGEARWDEAFAHSQDTLARLAEETLEEDRAGRTQVLDPAGSHAEYDKLLSQL